MADAPEGNLHLGNQAKSNWLTRISGFIIGAVLPIALYFSSKSVTFFVGLSAIMVQFGTRQLPVRAAIAVPRIVTGLALAFACICVFSITWSVFPDIALRTVAAVAMAVLVCAVLLAGYRKVLPYRFGFGLALALIVACCVALVQFLSEARLRPLLGMRADNFVYNRAMVYQSILIWPMLLLIEARDRVYAGIAILFIATAVLYSDSGAAAFGLLIGGLIAATAAKWPRVAIYGLAGGTAVIGLTAPWLGSALEAFKSSGIANLLQRAHAAERIDIWQAFGQLVRQHPLLGIGIGGSEKALQVPSAALVDAALQPSLAFNHPHSAFLQVWVELGVFGAVVFTSLCCAVVLSLRSLDGRTRILATGLAGASLSIAAVSHGAWQAWWISTVGTAIVIFMAANGRQMMQARAAG